MSDYSVLLPGQPMTADQAAADSFSQGLTTSPDLPAITVTAQALPSSSLSDWFKPPKLFITLAVGAGAAYFLFGRKRR